MNDPSVIEHHALARQQPEFKLGVESLEMRGERLRRGEVAPQLTPVVLGADVGLEGGLKGRGPVDVGDAGTSGAVGVFLKLDGGTGEVVVLIVVDVVVRDGEGEEGIVEHARVEPDQGGGAKRVREQRTTSFHIVAETV